jgi:hypothetical protein
MYAGVRLIVLWLQLWVVEFNKVHRSRHPEDYSEKACLVTRCASILWTVSSGWKSSVVRRCTKYCINSVQWIMLISSGIKVIIVQAPQQKYVPNDIHIFVPLLDLKCNLILILIIISFKNVRVVHYVNLTSLSGGMAVLKTVAEQGTDKV